MAALGPCTVKWKSFDKDGYARVWFPRTYDGPRKYMRANRYVWIEHYGDIPEEMCVLHKCDNPACVNIEHLFLGTHKDNAKDKTDKGRYQDQRGDKNPCSKLTNGQAAVIRLAANLGCRQQWLADYYGVGRSTISMIKNGLSRKVGLAI